MKTKINLDRFEIFISSFLFIGVLWLFSCNDNSASLKDEETILDIPSSQLSWDLTHEAKDIEVEFTCNREWSVAVDNPSWISVSQNQGVAGKHTLEITISANESETQRVGTLTISSGKLSSNIIIRQKEKTFQTEGNGPEDMPIEEWK